MRNDRRQPLTLLLDQGDLAPKAEPTSEVETILEALETEHAASSPALPPLPSPPSGLTPYFSTREGKASKAKPPRTKVVREKTFTSAAASSRADAQDELETTAPPAIAATAPAAVTPKIKALSKRAKPSVSAAATPRSPARFAYSIAIACAFLWCGAFVAFVTGFGKLGPFDYAPFRDVVIAALAVLPALFMLLFAYALRQGSKLGEDVRATRRLSEGLIGPVAVSAAQAGDLMRAMRGEIEQAVLVAEDAERRLASLREGLSDESRRLSEAAREAHAGARTLGEALGHERGGLERLSATLEARTAEITEAVARQTQLAADVSDLAQVQLAEAQASLAARAADLSAAAADVRDGAEAAGELLSRHGEQLDLTGVALTQRLAHLGEELTRERDQLAQLTEGLKLDHEDLSARAESQHARLSAAAAQARSDGEAAGLAATEAGETLRDLIAETAAQVRAAADASTEAREAAATQAQADLERIGAQADRQREATAAQVHTAIEALTGAAEQAQTAAAARLADLELQAQTLGASALERIEQLGEAAFSAGQRADQAFDARIGAAKRAIDQSAAAVEEAGLRSAQRIEAGLAGARTALGELDALLVEVDSRFSKLPEEARERADAVRTAVERGVGDLTAAARRAAEETTAIDEAFQERVRRNYDTLSEAVRLMGRVAGAVDAAARTPEPQAAPAAEPAAEVHALDLMARARDAAEQRAPQVAAEAAPVVASMPLAVGDSHVRFATTQALATDAAPLGSPDTGAGLTWRDLGAGTDLFEPPADPASRSNAFGLRPRLKLTATPDAPAPPIVVETAAQAPTPRRARGEAGDSWSWKELLSTLPEEPAVADDGDDEALADRLIGEIEALGLDVAALLPRAQVDDIAHGLQSGRGLGAREGVRRLAPAAVRRLSRRVLTDTVLRREADQFVRRYAALVDDAVRRDADGFLASALLGSDAGRAFLMLDAAIGDLAH